MAKKTIETPEQARPEQAHQAVAVSSGGAAARHTLRNIRLIIGREYKYRVTQRSFVITSIILLVVVAIAAFIPTIVQLIASGTNSPTHIVVVNHAGTVAGLDETKLISSIAGYYSRLHLVCCAPVSLWGLDVRAAAKPETAGETGTDELEAEIYFAT